MNPSEVIFLGLNKTVAAVRKSDGVILWETNLGGAMGDSFVTITCDDLNVFAYVCGHLFCLDILTGEIRWKNGLPGYGYGTGSLCLYGFPPAPDPAIYARLKAAREAASASSSSAPS